MCFGVVIWVLVYVWMLVAVAQSPLHFHSAASHPLVPPRLCSAPAQYPVPSQRR